MLSRSSLSLSLLRAKLPVAIGLALVGSLVLSACTATTSTAETVAAVEIAEPEVVEAEQPAMEETAVVETTELETVEIEEDVVDLSDSPLVGRWENANPVFPDDYPIAEEDIVPLFWIFRADGTVTNNSGLAQEEKTHTWTINESGAFDLTAANGNSITIPYVIEDNTLTFRPGQANATVLERVSS